jgi:peptidoglycan/LPS O-acetylase OafA/YrhL
VKQEATSGDRLPALDGVRGVAILMVLVFHFSGGLTELSSSPAAARWVWLSSVGQKGVDLFFVLSGFLITGILLRTKGSTHYFKNFYVRRSLRIFPLYYAVLIACLVFGRIYSSPQFQWHNNWWYLVYLQNIAITFVPASIAGPGHFWSLAVEEHFYFLWPLAVLLLGRRALAIFAGALMAAAVACRLAFLAAGLDVFRFTLCRMDTLALGSVLAIAYTSRVHWEIVRRWSARLALPVGAVSCVAFFFFSGSGGRLIQATKYSLFAGLCGLGLVLALSPGRWNPVPWMMSSSVLRAMGKTSYGMYVFHPFVYAPLVGRLYLSRWSPLFGRLRPALVAEFLLAMALTVGLSWVSWILFEMPVSRLKERFSYQVR